MTPRLFGKKIVFYPHTKIEFPQVSMTENQGIVWRLIPLLSCPGHLQMVIDEWLLEEHRHHRHPPALRFYTWDPPAISLGYHQRHYPSAWHDLQWQGKPLDLVRRPTGGRAVLHQGDLTYMVVTSGLRGHRLATYAKICEFLIQGWKSLGIDLNYGSAQATRNHHPNCFNLATGADLVLANGFKLIGSAQLHRDGAILQHGSMRLVPDGDLLTQVFGADQEEVQFPLTPLPAPSEIIAALTEAACDCFQIQLQSQPFSESEWASILARVSNTNSV